MIRPLSGLVPTPYQRAQFLGSTSAWPTLGEVLHETRDWFYVNAMLLPPDAPSLSKLRI